MSWLTNRRTHRPFFSRNRRDDNEERIAREFLAERANHAVSKGAKYLFENPQANGFTILHDDATGSVFDFDRPQDLITLHNVLPREDLYIIAMNQNRDLGDAYSSALTSPQALVDSFGSSPGFRVTTTGGYRYKDGHIGIDHGMLIATDLQTAMDIGHQFGQESIVELDNRGDLLRLVFHDL